MSYVILLQLVNDIYMLYNLYDLVKAVHKVYA